MLGCNVATPLLQLQYSAVCSLQDFEFENGTFIAIGKSTNLMKNYKILKNKKDDDSIFSLAIIVDVYVVVPP